VAQQTPRELGVLPFRGTSPDSDGARFADAVGQQIARRLQELRPGAVTGSGTPGQMELTQAAIASVARTIDARYLLSGTVDEGRRSVGVRVRLYDGATGQPIWRGEYEHTAGNLRSIENAIVQALAPKIFPDLTRTEVSGLDGHPTADIESYRHYLLGIRYLSEGTSVSLARAIQELDVARQEDPKFVAAWSNLALAYAVWMDEEAADSRPPDPVVLKTAVEVTDQALKVSPGSSPAWVARAILHEVRDPLMFAGARDAYERAIALDPRNSEAHGRYGRALMELGDLAAAQDQLEQAIAFDPDRWWTLTDLADVNLHERQFATACRLLNTAIAVQPWAVDAYVLRALVRLHLPDREIRNAYADAETAIRLGNRVQGQAALALSDMAAKDTAAALERLQQLLPLIPGPRGRMGVQDARLLAIALTAIGDRLQAQGIIERARPRGAALWWALQDPQLATLKDEGRYRAVVGRTRPATVGFSLHEGAAPSDASMLQRLLAKVRHLFGGSLGTS
jgi:tetratricopeptide (TPR) repeat protein